jgi:hypothetical protein
MVLNNDVDLDGDSLAVTELSPPAMGGSAVLDGGEIVYRPSPGFTSYQSGYDVFGYTVHDRRGAVAQTEARVYVASGRIPSPGQLGIDARKGGVWVRFLGEPGRRYFFEASPDLRSWKPAIWGEPPLHGVTVQV